MPVKQHILWRKKAEMLQSRVDELEEENGILKQQLEEKNSIQEQDVVRRYRRVLKLVQRGFRMTKAFKKA
ncbi:AP-1-like transcription factor napA [Dissostichus eleginoides]|uniref:AP-1-like transcription factor napA n=1 Tax=Dissostichus eleginoides TaxID=100907 RepID=A0AAD9FIA2_DISEL|nr:AP-1-like transcription factor napA [Dissostichus eleginoides]